MTWFEKHFETKEVICPSCRHIRRLGVWTLITESELEKLKDKGVKFIEVLCENCRRDTKRECWQGQPNKVG